MFREQMTYEHFENHPLFYKGSLKLYSAIAMSKSCDEMCQNLESFTVPMLIFQAETEYMVQNTKILELYRRSRSTDKKLVDVPGAWHIISHDPEFPSVIRQTIDWLNLHIPN
jgi:esterase/lipase